jgi:hypothetical protein
VTGLPVTHLHGLGCSNHMFPHWLRGTWRLRRRYGSEKLGIRSSAPWALFKKKHRLEGQTFKLEIPSSPLKSHNIWIYLFRFGLKHSRDVCQGIAESLENADEGVCASSCASSWENGPQLSQYSQRFLSWKSNTLISFLHYLRDFHYIHTLLSAYCSWK